MEKSNRDVCTVIPESATCHYIWYHRRIEVMNAVHENDDDTHEEPHALNEPVYHSLQSGLLDNKCKMAVVRSADRKRVNRLDDSRSEEHSEGTVSPDLAIDGEKPVQ